MLFRSLVGHALIMAVIVAIAADHTREVHFLPAVKKRIAAVPLGLATALVLFVAGYWGLHVSIYGPDGMPGEPVSAMSTHTPNGDHPHGAPVTGSIGPPVRRH